MNSTRTYEALVNLINSEFDKLQVTVNEAIKAARKDAGTDDAFDVTLGLANKLSFHALRMAVQLHNSSLENSRTHESLQLELPFPPN